MFRMVSTGWSRNFGNRENSVELPHGAVKLRLVHVVTDLDRRSGGPSVSVPQLCLGLARLPDTEVRLAARRTDEPVDLEDEDGFSVHWLDRRRPGVPVEVREPDPAGAATVVHLHGLWDPLFHRVAVAAWKRGLPVVQSTRGMLEPWALSHKRWKKRAGWWLYQRRDLRRAALLHGSSAAELASLDRVGLGDRPGIALPNGVTPPTNLDRLLADTKRERTLLFLGRLHPVKGLEPLLDAWSDSAPTGWTLQLTGPDHGGHGEALRARCRRLDIEGSVRFTGPVTGDEKWRLLGSAGCLVLPSHSENFGMVVAEALAAGTPVAASTGTPWEGLEATGAGWWVDPGTRALASFLRELGDRPPEELSAMGDRGRAWVARDFAWPAIAARFREHYEAIA